MRLLIAFLILSLLQLLPSSSADEVRVHIKRYEHNFGEILETAPPPTSTIVFDDIDTSHTIPSKDEPNTSQEPFIEPADSVSASANPTSSDPSEPPPDSTSNPFSKQKSNKPSSSSSEPSQTEDPPTETTTEFYKKLVKVHINPTRAGNYPTKGSNYPTFAAYDEGIVYIKGIPHQVLAADTNYNRLSQAEDGVSWEEAEKKDDKAKQEEADAELDHQDKLVSNGGSGNGNAVYSADLTSGEENAVKKAVFFSVIAAGIITLGLLAFFGIIG
ncbi:hypothetical protein TWF481_007005 [Arthrobotrys musiformis]|uniref:Mid2 domain-containing protein n=1 Tax=Arthrobotrys musiformis TaxID=47236 RepID=A0AAV9WBT9_9PEZI